MEEDNIKKEYRKLEEEKNKISKENQKLQKVVDEIEHNKRIERQIENYSLKGVYENTIILLKQLKYGKIFVGKLAIPEEEYSSIITNLFESEHPEMIPQINRQTSNSVKRLMCYLIVLGLDDENIMYRVTKVQSDTIRRYRKECLQIVKGQDG
ncbi:MAG: hypothetical protein IJ417_00730 [Bacteroidaceae bacterium]|nr:hypothetical protein [Bacteroidaceae bacterium]